MDEDELAEANQAISLLNETQQKQARQFKPKKGLTKKGGRK